jgi:hypothetical protein
VLIVVFGYSGIVGSQLALEPISSPVSSARSNNSLLPDRADIAVRVVVRNSMKLRLESGQMNL